MRRGPLNWLVRNLSAVILSIILAVAVWISAVVTADPNEEAVFRPVAIDLVGLGPDLVMVSVPPAQARLTLNAPRSIWEKLNSNPKLVKAWVDLSNLGPGNYTLNVQAHADVSPVRYTSIDPQTVSIELEPLLRRSLPVKLTIIGDPPRGYREGEPGVAPAEVVVSGPESVVARVAEVHATLNIAGLTSPVEQAVQVEVLDEFGAPVSGVTVVPRDVVVQQPINLLGGFKNVAVKVVTVGQVANGYRLTNISVSPPTVTLFADNPRLVEQVPGYVETLPVDLSNLSDDREVTVGLDLPEGISLISEPNVLVQVNVAAIEGSLTLSVPVEVIGLLPESQAVISPEMVDVIVAGPLNVLDTLTPGDFQVVLDLSGLPPGVYQRTPVVASAPAQVRVQTTLPETVEATISLAPTLTPVGTPTGILVLPGAPATQTVRP